MSSHPSLRTSLRAERVSLRRFSLGLGNSPLVKERPLPLRDPRTVPEPGLQEPAALRKVKSPRLLQVRNICSRKKGGHRHQACPWDGTTCILGKNDHLGSNSNEERSPWKNDHRRKCLRHPRDGSLRLPGIEIIYLRAPLRRKTSICRKGAPSPKRSHYRHRVGLGTAVRVSQER